MKRSLHVAICFCECSGMILMLSRSMQSSQPGMWTAPGGKCELNEFPHEGARRELYEETGIQVPIERLAPKGTLVQDHLGCTVSLYLFHTTIDSFPEHITLSSEHAQHCWIAPRDVLNLPLIFGASECIQKVFFEPASTQLVKSHSPSQV